MKTTFFILSIIFGFVAFVLLIFLLVSSYARYSCDNYSTNTGHQVKYNFWSGSCYVKTPNGWFSYYQINQNTVSE